jgi:hypothetical protein
VYNLVLQNPHMILESLNESYIIMVPTKEDAIIHIDIHAVQRILSKILAQRLQIYMQNLLQLTQIIFVKGRYILEGFLYA